MKKVLKEVLTVKTLRELLNTIDDNAIIATYHSGDIGEETAIRHIENYENSFGENILLLT